MSNIHRIIAGGRTSMFAFFVAWFALLLGFYSRSDVVIERLVVHNRKWRNVAKVIGPFQKTTVASIDLEDNSTLSEVTERAWRSIVAAFMNDVPGSFLAKRRGPTLNFTATQPELPRTAWPNWLSIDSFATPEPLVVPRPMVLVTRSGEGVAVNVRYHESWFSEDRISLLLAHADLTLELLQSSASMTVNDYRKTSIDKGFQTLIVSS